MRRFILSLIYNVLTLVEFLLLVRVILQALSANAAATVVEFIYKWTDVLIEPVEAIFPNLELGASVVDLVAIAAMVFYAIVAWLLIKIFSFIFHIEKSPF